ncbi:MAG: hypothetical protein FJ224_08930 [Lentisphaerae bacterium]|nr:hypothetical protein [Lentisphaerota bacterium]
MNSRSGEIGRREFFRTFLRNSAIATLGAGAAALAGRRAVSGSQSCTGSGVCSGCPGLDGCGTPQALHLKRAGVGREAAGDSAVRRNR